VSEQILEVAINPDGTVEMHVRGIEGMSCLAETQELVTALGGEVESQTLTAEAYAVVDQDQEEQDRLWH